MELKYIKKDSDNYETIRHVLRQEFKMSSNLILKLKKAKLIFLNNEFTYLDKTINNGDIISVCLDFNEDNSNIVSTKMNLDILYEDEGLLIVNKSAEIPVHPSALHFKDTLSNGVRYYYDKNSINRKIRIVNRLDRNTSGIVIFAKNEYIQERLAYQMKSKEFRKEYIAICEGYLDNKDGIINAKIDRKDNSIIERCISNNGQTAITKYNVIKEINNMSEIHIILETGRTHQIRVHMAHIGHPIVGDDLYGHSSNLINRQALHAYKVTFKHPISGKKLEILSDLPDDMKSLI